MRAHRQHFYQTAVDKGLSVYQTVGGVFAANVALIGAASLTLYDKTPAMQLIAVAAGAAIVATLLWSLRNTSR